MSHWWSPAGYDGMIEIRTTAIHRRQYMDPRGFYHKYQTINRDTGDEVDPDTTFTLRPGSDQHARVALAAYAASVESVNPDLARDLRDHFNV